MTHNPTVRQALRSELKSAWFAKETYNFPKLSQHKENIRTLWKHRNTNKPASAYL